jgi:phage shock protein PspC (stress-responsive transcriptional regulator)
MVRPVPRREHRNVTNQTSTPTPPPASQPGSNRFFAWLRSLGIVRSDGWLGGVCGGIALRTGLDPLIVRGIAVVAAILGGPALFFYAVAWLLLPDTHGDIHLERMIRGVFDAPLIAIGVLVALTFVPFTQGVWWVGDHVVGSTWWLAAPATVLHVLWNLAIIGAIVWFVVWLVGRVRTTRPGEHPFAGTARAAGAAAGTPWRAEPAQAGEARDAAGSTDERPEQRDEASSGQASDQPSHTEQSAPPAPGAGAGNDAYAEWRERYDAWRHQHAAWQEQQRASSYEARTAQVAEARARSQQYAAEAARLREARRAANPRAAGWLVALVLGAALIAGGIVGAVTATDSELSRYAAPIGTAVALIVIGLGMVVAGAARRRSGFLAFTAIAVLVLGIGSFGWPAHDPTIGFSQMRADHDLRFTQFAGQVEVDASKTDLGDGTREVKINQTFGAVAVYIADGVDARVTVTSRDSNVHPYLHQGDGSLVEQRGIRVRAHAGESPVTQTWTTGGSASPELVVDVVQGAGGVYIYDGGANPSSGNNDLD